MSIFKEFFFLSNFRDRRHFGFDLKTRFPQMGKVGFFLWVIYKPMGNSGKSYIIYIIFSQNI